MKNNPLPVITISRQLGSGGTYIGQQLAKKLNIFYADREIISQAAKQLSVLKEELELRDEKILTFWQSFLQPYAVGLDSYIPPQVIPPSDRKVFDAESEVITGIAKERPAVIIGRCSSYILREHPNHVSIFLHADISFRKGRVQKMYNVSEEAAEKMIIQNDKDRALYNYTFTGKEWVDTTQYDISIETGKIGVDKSVELILKYLDLI